MKPAWISSIVIKRGFTLLEFLLSLALLAIIVTSYTAIQINLAHDFVNESEDCEQILQMNTAIDCLKEVCYQAYATEIHVATLRYSKQAVFYLKDEFNNTKVIRFYLERYSGVLYESIQGTSSPGVLQLAVEIGDLDFLWHDQPKGLTLEVIFQGKSNPQQKIQRYFFLRNCSN